MPPKGSGKPKGTAATPKKPSAKEAPKQDTPKKPTPKKPADKATSKPTTPKKTKENVLWDNLKRNKHATLPIEVSFPGGIAEAKQIKSNFTHTLKLESNAQFTLLDTYVNPERHEHEGYQVIIIKPAKAFPLMKLPAEVRKRIFCLYFASKGIEGEPATIDGKRKNELKDPYAKNYAEGSKYRVALLAVNKEIHNEAMPLFYALPLRFDTPSTLMTFFAGLPSGVRMHLRHVEIRSYVKKDAKTALAFLAEAKNLAHLRIEMNVVNEDDVAKAAKSFWLDIGKLLEAVGAKFDKKMVAPRKPKPKVPKRQEHDASEEGDEDNDEDDDDQDDEESEEDESEVSDAKASQISDADNDSENNAEDAVEASDSGNAGIASDAADSKLASDDNKSTSSANGIKTNSTDAAARTKAIADWLANSNEKKNARTKQTPQLVLGEKCWAVDILDLGKQALKNKDSKPWSAAKKQEFLNILEAKLNTSHLAFWTCICGCNVRGHSCSEELRARLDVAAAATAAAASDEFWHLDHGGAGMVNEAFQLVS